MSVSERAAHINSDLRLDVTESQSHSKIRRVERVSKRKKYEYKTLNNGNNNSIIWDRRATCGHHSAPECQTLQRGETFIHFHPKGHIFSRGVCVERTTHPLHNNDGFCLHLPVFLLSASSAELQLIQRQPRRTQ
ncbi:uncharacterized protein LOC127439690 isoform X1 [Myxocyprinus asiaticus]|uniref:uncharacterized protein LOC127439690 isoform X1 n=1 Tax=Myxocyprinus asiaticus TaxID=70543 RepID=UPI0022227683|nr:uncharacterized protein LOC127439690 isoform X1 [Myxocyprinus asiaticus]